MFLGLAVLASALAVYFRLTFLGMKDPFTQVLPASINYFAYVRNYQQVQADVWLCVGSCILSSVIAALSLGLTKAMELPQLAPLRRFGASMRSAPLRLKTAALLIPLLLLEVGFAVYGGLMGIASFDFTLSLQLRQDLVITGLFIGPFSSFGGSYGAAQDYYFLVLFVLVLAGAWYRFESVRRVLQVGSLAIVPLPALIFLFDRIEFNTFFASVADRVGLGWFSNALLLYLAVAVFVGSTSYPFIRRRVGKAKWVPSPPKNVG